MSKLEEMLKYVSENNEFYKNRIKEYGIKNPLDITQWPILTREELQKNRYNMFSNGYELMYYSKQLLRQHSSGTSGVPVSIYWSTDDYFTSMLPLWRSRKKYYNILPNSKRVSFNYSKLNEKTLHGLKYKLNKNEISVMCSSLYNAEIFKELILVIQSYEPEWLYIQPSVLSNLIFYYQYFDMLPPRSIRYIETVGEILSDNIRKKAALFFNSSVANMYGSEEMNCIAYECANNELCILNSNVFVECLKHNNKIEQCGSGDAIITSLTNKAMPLIRYSQGDRITIETINEGLHDQSRKVLSNIEGRTRSNIVNQDVIITPFMLVRAIDTVNNCLNNPIQKFHFDYYSIEKNLVCTLWISNNYFGWLNAIKNKVIEQLKPYCFDNLTINVNSMENDYRNNMSKNEILIIHS